MRLEEVKIIRMARDSWRQACNKRAAKIKAPYLMERLRREARLNPSLLYSALGKEELRSHKPYDVPGAVVGIKVQFPCQVLSCSSEEKPRTFYEEKTGFVVLSIVSADDIQATFDATTLGGERLIGPARDVADIILRNIRAEINSGPV